MKKHVFLFFIFGLYAFLAFAQTLSPHELFEQHNTLYKEKKYEESLLPLMQAAEKGYVKAQNRLGYMYWEGKNLPKNDSMAAKWYLKAAEQNYDSAQVNLAYLYEKGFGVAKNDTIALKWYLKAAEKANAMAQIQLGFIYAEGKCVTKDTARAIEWFLKAKDSGNAYAEAVWGFMHYKGFLVPENDSIAFFFFQKAAKKNSEEAEYYLGNMYKNGYFVSQNDSIALKSYQKSAEKGHYIAQYELAEAYYWGNVVSHSDTTAFKWYQKSAEQGYDIAQYKLALMYEGGYGTSKSDTLALKYYTLSAEQGFYEAEHRLFFMYKYGLGVKKNDSLSQKWYKKLTEKGYIIDKDIVYHPTIKERIAISQRTENPFLYLNTGEMLTLKVSGLDEQADLYCEPENGVIKQSSTDKTKFLFVPRSNICKVTIYPINNNHRQRIGIILKEAIEPPKPSIVFYIDGKKAELPLKVAKGERLLVKAIPDSTFKMNYPNDAKYSFGDIDIFLGTDLLMKRVGGADLRNKSAGIDIPIPPSDLFGDIQGTKKVNIRISDVYRKNFQGLSFVDDRFTKEEKSFDVFFREQDNEDSSNVYKKYIIKPYSGLQRSFFFGDKRMQRLYYQKDLMTLF